MDAEAAARLLAENVAQREQLAELTAALAAARADADAQRKLAEARHRQVQRLVDQVSALTEMLRRFLGDRVVPPSDPGDEEPDPEPPAPAVGGGVGGAPQGGSRRERPAAPVRKGKGPGKGGRRGPGATLPVDTLEPAAPARCPSCGGERLLAKDWEVSTKFTAVRGFVRKLEIRREVCTCADCNARVCAPMPPMPWKASQFTPELVALVVHTKFTLGVPLDRLYQDLRRQGVNLAWSSLVYLIDRAARLFDVVDGEHWKQLKAGPVLGVDGTGLDVVVPGLGETWHGYLDVFCRDDIHVYQYSPTKHADVLKEKLGRYAGTVVCDAEYRNDILFGPGIVEANCNAHPRRKLRDAEAREPVLARQAREFLDRMYAVEEEARRHGLNGAALLRLRQARTRPVAEKFRRWISETVPTLLPSNPVGKVLRYYDRHFTALTRFVDDPNLPIDNNRSERAFQVHAKLRVAAEFAGSTEGAHRWATLLGVVNTAKRLDVDVLAYLTWAIERLGTWRKIYALPAAQLTPEAYKLTCAAGATAA